MEIEFDPAKDEANLKKHGLSLADAVAVFDDPAHAVIPSIRLIDGEERFKVVGLVGARCHTAVFVWRGFRRRFISFRPSNPKEIKRYERP